MEEFYQVRKSHEITESMNNDTAGQMTRSHEKKCRIHSENGRVTKLKGGDEKRCLQILTATDSLNHMMEMSNAKKERRHNHSSLGRIIAHQDWHHASTEMTKRIGSSFQ